MDELRIKPKTECRWDCVSRGEVILRRDPGPGRVATTRQFQAWEGSGEYNVTRSLKRCFGSMQPRRSTRTLLWPNPLPALPGSPLCVLGATAAP